MDKIKLLVVEDEQQVFNLLKLTMAPLGFEAEYIESTEDVVGALREKKIQILITDFLMPKKNGLEVARDVRAEDDLKTFPIVLLTSKELLHEEMKEISELNIDYLRKPFMPQILSSKLKELLSRTGT